ncbi:MAG: peptidylprolyl isomerase [Gemmatimonadota bacterium]
MRRSWWFLGLTVVLAGCDAFRAHPDSAAEAAGVKLPPSQLAVMMASVKGIKANRGGGEFAGRLWIDYVLVTNMVASKANYTDSAFVAEAMWADITEMRGVRWHDSLVTLHGHIGPNSVDSAFRAGEARELQHILIRADSGSPDSVMVKARKRAEQALARLKKGEEFGKVASDMSDDPGSKFRSGILPIEPRGKWAKQFDEVGWKLAPGQLSPVFTTRFGYHVMRRPTFEESKDAFHQYLLRSASAAVDSTYFDSLPLRWNLAVVPKAPGIIRDAMSHPDAIRDSAAVLATYTGGNLPLSTLLRWANALPIQFTERLGSQADSGLIRFVEIIGQNILLIKEADSAHVVLDAEDWSGLKDRYVKAIDSLKIALDINGQGFLDSAATPDARLRLVADRVDSLFTRANNTGRRLPPIPFQLAPVLRSRYPHNLNESGIDDALSQLKLMNEDSATAAARRKPKPDGSPPSGTTVIPSSQAAPGARRP